MLRDAGELLTQHMLDYSTRIDTAYCMTDDALTVALTAKFTPDSKGVKLETTINFVAERIKDKAKMVFTDAPPADFGKDDIPWPETAKRQPITCGYSRGYKRVMRSKRGLK